MDEAVWSKVMPSPLTAAPNRPISGRVKMIQIVPITFQGMRSGSASVTRLAETPQPRLGHHEGDKDAQGDLDEQHQAGKQELAPQGIVEAGVVQYRLEPLGAHEHPLAGTEDVLDRIIDPRSSAG